jgi:hypothetical protein
MEPLTAGPNGTDPTLASQLEPRVLSHAKGRKTQRASRRAAWRR